MQGFKNRKWSIRYLTQLNIMHEVKIRRYIIIYASRFLEAEAKSMTNISIISKLHTTPAVALNYASERGLMCRGRIVNPLHQRVLEQPVVKTRMLLDIIVRIRTLTRRCSNDVDVKIIREACPKSESHSIERPLIAEEEILIKTRSIIQR